MLFIIKSFNGQIEASFKSFRGACQFASANHSSNTIIELSVSYYDEDLLNITRKLFVPEIPSMGRDQIRIFLDGKLLFGACSFEGLFNGIRGYHSDLSHMHAANLTMGRPLTRMTNLYFTKHKDTPLADPLVYREYGFRFFEPSQEKNYAETNWQQEGF